MTALVEPPSQELELSTVLAALADPVRLRIVAELRERRDVQCGSFDVPVARSTLSHHLKVLREAGITHTRIEGVERYVTLREADLEARFPGVLTAVLQALEPKRRGKRGGGGRIGRSG